MSSIKKCTVWQPIETISYNHEFIDHKKQLSFWQEIKYQHTKAFLPSTHESYKQK